jgi:hypothetical protein
MANLYKMMDQNIAAKVSPGFQELGPLRSLRLSEARVV